MSKANGAIENKDTFLQHVSLKNYKSIKDVGIDFKPGLNIIIGKNSSGKTNFINGLNILLNSDYEKFLDSESTIKAWFKGVKVEIIALSKNLTNEDLIKDKFQGDFINHQLNLKINDNNIKINDYGDLSDELYDNFFFLFFTG